MNTGNGVASIETGEIIATLTPEQARDVTDRIRTALGVTWELVIEAWTGRAWAALGYGTWDSYIAAEFGSARLRLPAEDRREVIVSLRDAGMSQRAIAAATGVGKGTIHRDLDSGAPNGAPDGTAAEDPEDRPSVEPGSDAPESAKAADSGAPQDQEIKVTATIKGRDGKTYPAKTTKKVKGDLALLRLHAGAGKTTSEIALAMGRTRESVLDLANRYGVTITGGNTRAGIDARVEKARQMASEGCTSAQIGQAIGVENMTGFKARHNLDVPADAVVGRSKKSVDADRVVSETVATLEGVVMSIGLIGDPAKAGLDADQIDDWATSLGNSLRLLNRFSKQLKEMTQ